MDKIKATFIHFLISLVVILFFVLFVYCVWYEVIFFNISGVSVPLKILIVVDVLMGPLLTFVVYKKGKKTLKLDLTLIATFQLVAFLYGAYSIYLGKPSLVVHRTGYFEVLTEKTIDYGALSQDVKRQNFWLFPVYGKIESDDLTTFSGASDYLDMVTVIDIKEADNFSKPLSLQKMESSIKGSTKATKRLFENLKNSDKGLIFYDVQFGNVFGVMVIDKSTMEIIEFLEL